MNRYTISFQKTGNCRLSHAATLDGAKADAQHAANTMCDAVKLLDDTLAVIQTFIPEMSKA